MSTDQQPPKATPGPLYLETLRREMIGDIPPSLLKIVSVVSSYQNMRQLLPPDVARQMNGQFLMLIEMAQVTAMYRGFTIEQFKNAAGRFLAFELKMKELNAEGVLVEMNLFGAPPPAPPSSPN